MSTRTVARRTMTITRLPKASRRQQVLLLLCALFLLSGCFGGGESVDEAYRRGYRNGKIEGQRSSGSDVDYAYLSGKIAGLEEGRAAGLQAGREKGYQDGLKVGLQYAAAATPTPSPVPTSTPEQELVTVTLSSQLYPANYYEQVVEIMLAGEPENLLVNDGNEKATVDVELPEGFHCYEMNLDLTDRNHIHDAHNFSGGVIAEGGDEFQVVQGENEWRLDNADDDTIVIADQLREGETMRLVHIAIPYQEDIVYALIKDQPTQFIEIPLPSNGLLEYAISAAVYDGTSPKPQIFEPNISSSLSITSGVMYQPELEGKSFVLKLSSYCDKAEDE
jgi:hypothetical protein